MKRFTHLRTGIALVNRRMKALGLWMSQYQNGHLESSLHRMVV